MYGRYSMTDDLTVGRPFYFGNSEHSQEWGKNAPARRYLL